MTFSKAFLIARREYVYNFKRRSYLVSAFLMPLIIGGLSYILFAYLMDAETNLAQYDTVGYVDYANIITSSDEANNADSRFQPYESEDTAFEAFNANDINGYFVIPEDYLTTAQVSFYDDKKVPEALRDEFAGFLINSLTKQMPETVSTDRLKDPLNQQIHILGEDETLSIEAAVARFVIPLVYAFLMIINIMTIAQFLASSVVEEKENQIMEILVTSCRPIELITGKVLGMGALGLTQIGFWLTVGLGVGALTGRLDILADAQFDAFIILSGILYFVLTYMLFAGIMVGVGAAATVEQEARQMGTIFILLTILPPSWTMGLIMENPDSPLALVMTFFPFTAPLTNMFMIAAGDFVAWRVILSFVILIISIMFALWFSARVFRAGMLNYGQRLGFKQLRHLLKG